MSWSNCFTTRCWNRNNCVTLKKKVLISNVQQVKSEQCFAVTNTKMVAIFKAKFKISKKRGRIQISNKDYKCSTFYGSEHLWMGAM